MAFLRTAADWLGRTRSRRDLLRLCLILGIAIGLLAHGFMFANKIPNHDDLEYYYSLSDAELDAGLGAGRYFLFAFWKLFSDLSTPWLNGIIGVLFSGFAAFFLCDALDWRQNWQIVAATLITQLYPANMDIYTYMYEAHVLMLGLMLAALAPWLMRYGGKLRMLYTALAVWTATGIYQVFVMVAIGYLILYVIHRTIEGVKEKEKSLKAWSEAIQCAAAAIAGLLCYLVGLKLMAGVLHVKLNEYQGMNQAGSLNIALIPQKILQAYRMVWEEYVSSPPSYVNGRMQLFRLPLVVLGVGGLVWAVIRCVVRKAPAQTVLLAVCGLILPLVCCGILFMGDTLEQIHTITLYPMVIMLLLPLTVIRPAATQKGAVRRALALATAILYLGLGFTSMILSNQYYYRMHQSFTRAEHFASRLAMRIESLEGYYPGIPFKNWGQLFKDDPRIFYEKDIAPRFWDFCGIRMENEYMWTYCTVNMLNAVIGLPVTDGQKWGPQTPEEEAQLQAMPNYPAEGSVAIIGGTCVVKIHE